MPDYTCTSCSTCEHLSTCDGFCHMSIHIEDEDWESDPTVAMKEFGYSTLSSDK